jgi:hypothetical protein
MSILSVTPLLALVCPLRILIGVTPLLALVCPSLDSPGVVIERQGIFVEFFSLWREKNSSVSEES